MNPKLCEVAEIYHTNKQRILKIEGKSGMSSLTMRTVNDIRHTLDHVLIAVTLEDKGNDEKALYHYTQAYEHMREYVINAHHIVAGKGLKKSKEAIKGAGFFSATSQSRSLHEEAFTHYDQGREMRTVDPDAALNHFIRSIEFATDSRLGVVEASRREKWAFKISIVALIVLLINLFFVIWNFLC